MKVLTVNCTKCGKAYKVTKIYAEIKNSTLCDHCFQDANYKPEENKLNARFDAKETFNERD